MEIIEEIRAEDIDLFASFIPEQLKEEYLFTPGLHFYGISMDEFACGAAVVRADGVIAELCSLFLAEDFRGFGLAARTFSQLLFLLQKEGFETVTARYIPEDNPKFHRLLLSESFQMTGTDNGSFHFLLGDLKDNTSLNGTASHVVSLADLPDSELRLLCQNISLEGKALVPMPVNRKDYLADCSGIYLENDTPKGILLLRQTGEKEILLPFLYVSAKNPLATLDLFRFAYAKASRIFPPDTACRLHTVNGTLTRLLEKLLERNADREVIASLSLSALDYCENLIQALFL